MCITVWSDSERHEQQWVFWPLAARCLLSQGTRSFKQHCRHQKAHLQLSFIMERTLVSLVCIAAIYLRQKRCCRRSICVHKILRTWRLHGEYHRLDKSQFDYLLTKIGPRIRRVDTNYRRAICPAERLAICLR
ncbi:hypothetical protein N1851_032906 [Merluccius polli]|uniref:Uncharacterized protein n=1 Tax=Merluccius polli TaxID=89951 RepID=A0AA47NQ07_MERPO|nr:hypothetical protein N1851_032906 [Merluccius polli]